LATPLAFRSIHDEMLAKNVHAQPPRRKAGHKLFGDTQPALVVAKGRLAPNASHTPSQRSHKPRRGPVFSLENALTRDFQHT
jgi:large subunit ribosomal protein L17